MKGDIGIDYTTRKQRLSKKGMPAKKKPHSDAAEKALGNKIEKADYKGEEGKKFSRKSEDLKGEEKNS